MADGTSENPTPRTNTNTIAKIQLVRNGIANNVCTKINNIEPIIIIVAPFPFLSYIVPKRGVNNIFPNGSSAGIVPAND